MFDCIGKSLNDITLTKNKVYLTCYILVDSSSYILEESICHFRGVCCYFVPFILFLMAKSC